MKSLKEYTTATEQEKMLLIRCRNAIKSIEPAAEVILYGSRARGEATPDSDYDLLVLIDGDVNLEREDLLRRQLFPIEIETGYVLSVVVYNKRIWNTPLYRAMPFYQNLNKDGVIL